MLPFPGKGGGGGRASASPAPILGAGAPRAPRGAAQRGAGRAAEAEPAASRRGRLYSATLPRGLEHLCAPGGASGSGAALGSGGGGGMGGAYLAWELAHAVLLLSLFPAGGRRGRGRARSPAGRWGRGRRGRLRGKLRRRWSLWRGRRGQRRAGGPGIALRRLCGTPRRRKKKVLCLQCAVIRGWERSRQGPPPPSPRTGLF